MALSTKIGARRTAVCVHVQQQLHTKASVKNYLLHGIYPPAGSLLSVLEFGNGFIRVHVLLCLKQSSTSDHDQVLV